MNFGMLIQHQFFQWQIKRDNQPRIKLRVCCDHGGISAKALKQEQTSIQEKSLGKENFNPRKGKNEQISFLDDLRGLSSSCEWEKLSVIGKDHNNSVLFL